MRLVKGPAVTLWDADLRAQADSSDISDLLSDDERVRAERLRTPGARQRFTAGRAALRRVLSEVVGVAPGDLEFRATPTGKPVLRRPEGVHFSLSRSHDVALIAISSDPVGVDVERLRDDYPFDQTAPLIMSARELAAYQAEPPEGRPLRWLQCWTRKEAWVKATGEGLRAALTELDMSLVDEDATDDRPPGTAWSTSITCLPTYVAAVAVLGGPATVEYIRN